MEPPVHITGKHFRTVEGQPEVMFDILYDGERYRCDKATLDLLYDGADINDFDLTSLDDEDDDD